MLTSEEKEGISGLLLAFIIFLVLASAAIMYFAVFGRQVGKYNEETRRQIYEESRAYNEGMAQNLDKLCLEWETSGNAAVAQSIRHRVSGFNGELPDHIQQCVNLARKVN